MGAVESSAAQGSFHEDLGIWTWIAAQAPVEVRAALFLDRDGVIVQDPGYLSRVADLELIPGAADLIASANRRSIPVVEITNQAGIGRGYYGWNEFLQVEEALARELAGRGAVIDAVFACPYHRDGIPPWAHPAHPARKPRPGMLLAAERFLNLDLKHSWIVGDKLGDLLAGYNAGLYGGLHVLTGQGPKHRRRALEWSPKSFQLRFADSICDAADLVGILG
jgi:D-glycero-D-manno-heptose 1,7-bisphosphate phosphatase